MAQSSKHVDTSSSAQQADESTAASDAYDTESAPLLVDDSERVKATPLPLAQLFILAIVRLAEPISFTQVPVNSNCLSLYP